ncbi:unnamed protein product, partial [Rotaria magnacalcarata]
MNDKTNEIIIQRADTITEMNFEYQPVTFIYRDKKNELNIILNCKRKQSDLYQLEDLVQADCLTPIMYLLKRQQNLDDFFTSLTFKYQRMYQPSEYQLQEQANLSLRMLLHILFMNSDMFLRRIIMSLL